MKIEDVPILENKLQLFSNLLRREAKIREAISRIENQDPTGPCQQGPFTSNTRESRRVVNMKLEFSPTLGRSEAVNCALYDLHISASLLGQFLTTQLREELMQVKKAMEDL